MQAVTITQITPPELQSLIEDSIRKVLNKRLSESHPEADQLLTIQQASDFLNLSIPTLYGYSQRHEIPVCKRGGRLYFSRQALTDWVKQGRKITVAEATEQADKYMACKKERGQTALMPPPPTITITKIRLN